MRGEARERAARAILYVGTRGSPDVRAKFVARSLPESVTHRRPVCRR